MYEQLMMKHDACILKAITAPDTDLAAFYYHAAEGYLQRALALSLKEVQ